MQQRNPFTFKWNRSTPNTKMACKAFIVEAFHQVRNCSTTGILPMCVSPAEYALLHPAGPMVILASPGDMPGGGARHAWEHLNNAFENQQMLYRACLTHITSPDANMPSDIIRSMHEGEHGLANRDLRWIFTFLKNFCVFTLTDITVLKESFVVPWDRVQEIRTFVHDKQQIISILAANFAPINNFDAYEQAKKWFSVQHWANCWIEHARNHGTPELLNIADLFRDIIAYCDTSLQHITAAQAGYHAAAAVALPSATPPSDAVIERAFAAFMAKQRPKCAAYCWSHGESMNPTHTSKLWDGTKGCKHPKPGHDQSATPQDHKGGK